MTPQWEIDIITLEVHVKITTFLNEAFYFISDENSLLKELKNVFLQFSKIQIFI